MYNRFCENTFNNLNLKSIKMSKIHKTFPLNKKNVEKLAKPYKEENYRATMGNFGKWMKE